MVRWQRKERRDADFLLSETKIMMTFKEQFLLVAGLKKEEIAKIDLDELSNEDLHSIVRQRLLDELAINGSRQKVLPLQEVKSYIMQGYEYLASLPSDEAAQACAQVHRGP